MTLNVSKRKHLFSALRAERLILESEHPCCFYCCMNLVLFLPTVHIHIRTVKNSRYVMSCVVFCAAGILFRWWYDIPYRHNHCSGNVVKLFRLSRWSCLWGKTNDSKLVLWPLI